MRELAGFCRTGTSLHLPPVRVPAASLGALEPGSPVNLAVSISDVEVAIRVENPSGLHPSRGPGTGQGLRGMTERAQLLGGRVAAGERDGVWMVEAVIPLSGRLA